MRSVHWFLLGLLLLLAACGGGGGSRGPDAAARQFADAVVANELDTARTLVMDGSDVGTRTRQQVDRETGGLQSASVENVQTSGSQSSVIIHWRGPDAIVQTRWTFTETPDGWKISGVDPGYWQIIPR